MHPNPERATERTKSHMEPILKKRTRRSNKPYSLYMNQRVDGNATLVWDYCRNSDGERIRIPVPFAVHGRFFDAASGKFLSDTPNATILNNRIAEIGATVEAAKIEGISEADLRGLLDVAPRINRSARKKPTAATEPTAEASPADDEPFAPHSEPTAAALDAAFPEPAPDYSQQPPKDIFFDNRQQELDAAKQDSWLVFDLTHQRPYFQNSEKEALETLDAIAGAGRDAVVYERKYAAKIIVERIKF